MIPGKQEIDRLIEACLEEDVGSGDLTAQLVPDTPAKAQLICREPAVLCGQPYFDAVFARLDPAVTIGWREPEGARLGGGEPVCEINGPARSLLTGERTAINLLQTLSGTATLAYDYARRLDGLKTRVLDTRKTIPGLRIAQKYATRVGGADNHRIALYDGVLIKENHIAAAGSIAAAFSRARENAPEGALLEVEVETLNQLEEAIAAGVPRVLLDNFDLDGLRSAVALCANRVELEASGGVTMENLRDIAETGVDYISVGALTKHLRAIDFSLRFLPGFGLPDSSPDTIQ